MLAINSRRQPPRPHAKAVIPKLRHTMNDMMSVNDSGLLCLYVVSCVLVGKDCLFVYGLQRYTEKPTEAWHHQRTQQNNGHIQLTQTNVNRHNAQTKHRALLIQKPTSQVTSHPPAQQSCTPPTQQHLASIHRPSRVIARVRRRAEQHNNTDLSKRTRRHLSPGGPSS